MAEMRPIALFSKHLGWLTVDQLGPVASEMGFTAVQLTVRPGGHVAPERAEIDLPRALRTLQLSGLSVPSVVTAVTDPETDTTRRLVGAIAAAGIPRYRMGWYRFPETVFGDPGNPAGEGATGATREGGARAVQAAIDEARRGFEGFARLNEEFGVQGLYENHAGRFVGASPWNLWYLLRDLPPRYLGVEFDLRHAMIEGWSSWMTAYELLAERMGTVLVKDFRWEADPDGSARVRNVPLGTGVTDFTRLAGLLGRDAYEGPVVLHAEYPVSIAGSEGDRHLHGDQGSVSGAPRDPFTLAAATALMADLRAARKLFG